MSYRRREPFTPEYLKAVADNPQDLALWIRCAAKDQLIFEHQTGQVLTLNYFTKEESQGLVGKTVVGGVITEVTVNEEWQELKRRYQARIDKDKEYLRTLKTMEDIQKESARWKQAIPNYYLDE